MDNTVPSNWCRSVEVTCQRVDATGSNSIGGLINISEQEKYHG